MTSNSIDKFLELIEIMDPDELDNLIQRNLARGGKFALLTRILTGDKEAAHELRELIDSGIVGPGFDYSSRDDCDKLQEAWEKAVNYYPDIVGFLEG